MFLEQYYTNGKLTYFRLPRFGCKEVNPFFASISNLYVELEQQRSVLSPNVIIARRQVICQFLLFLEECGHQSLETVQPSDIRAYIPELTKRQPKGIIYTLPIIHNFCRVLNEKGIQGQAWADILDVKLPVTKVVRMPCTRAEAEKLLKAPNTETPMGLRDAAMILLAARTGLRAIDILNLKLSNIDWRANEITIVQHKTGKALSLPLFADVGNAISSYILHGRPNSDSKYVFLTTKSPYVKLSDRTTSIVQRNMEKAELPKKKNFGSTPVFVEKLKRNWYSEIKFTSDKINHDGVF
jgi:integrase/recombinase XerD